MSHRTDHLNDGNAFQRLLNQLRYKEVYRQGIGILLILVYALLATPLSPWWEAGVVLVVVGSLIRLWAAGMVMKNEVLATSGPYARVRHPLYVGNILVLFGMVAVASRWELILVTLAFLWFFYPPAIRYEDMKLERLFGDSWRDWRARTSALWPSLRAYPGGDKSARWSLKLAAGRNGELMIIAYVIACVLIALYF